MTRAGLMLLAVANVLFAVGLYVLGHFGYGIASTVSYSKYVGLQSQHAIAVNPAALKNIANAGLTEQSDVHAYLTDGFRDGLKFLDVAVVILLLNGVGCAIAWWRSRRAVRSCGIAEA